jgi:hypothetical protein
MEGLEIFFWIVLTLITSYSFLETTGFWMGLKQTPRFYKIHAKVGIYWLKCNLFLWLVPLTIKLIMFIDNVPVSTSLIYIIGLIYFEYNHLLTDASHNLWNSFRKKYVG